MERASNIRTSRWIPRLFIGQSIDRDVLRDPQCNIEVLDHQTSVTGRLVGLGCQDAIVSRTPPPGMQ
jgi:hypothetical protein